MELYIFEKDLNLKGIVDNFISLIWIRRFYKPGEFQLVVPGTIDNFKLLTEGSIIYKKGSKEAGYIITRQIDKRSTGEEVLTVKGKFVTNYINKRINWGRINFKGTVENLMRKLVNDNCVNPIDSNRKIPDLILGNLNGFTEKVEYQNSFGALDVEIEALATSNELGYSIDFDYKAKRLIFNIYKGVDRSINQSQVAPCIFSREFENILSQNLFESSQYFKNTCLIGGEGDGIDRIMVDYGSSVGLDRNELFVDARDLQRDIDGNQLGLDEYKEILLNRGNEKLSEHKKIITFESTVSSSNNNKYKEDYDLGDIVTVVDKIWGVKIDTRITEVEEVYEDDGININPTFGDSIPTLIDKINRERR